MGSLQLDEAKSLRTLMNHIVLCVQAEPTHRVHQQPQRLIKIICMYNITYTLFSSFSSYIYIYIHTQVYIYI